MRATELNIVFEDDEHHEHVLRFEGDDAELARSVLAAVPIIGDNPRPSFEGRVLRKVTEVEGHVEDYPGDEAYIASSASSGNTILASVLPGETRKWPCTAYRFRFTVEAVPVTKGGSP